MTLRSMKLQSKLILYLAVSSVLAMLIGMFVQKLVIDEVEIDRAKAGMRSALVQAETVRENASRLASGKVYDYSRLLAEIEESDDFRETAFYGTIPVVASWKSVERVAGENGYTFRIIKRQPRNAKNEPNAKERAILESLKRTGADEYFADDSEADELVYARPIRLTQDCLFCHGDPDTSPSGDGLDLLGYEMEDWREGEMHGAFVLRASKSELRAMGAKAFLEGAGRSALFTMPSVFCVIMGLVWMLRRTVFRPIREKLGSVGAFARSNFQSSQVIRGASVELSEGVSRQAASIEETAATLEEIASLSRVNAEKSGAAKHAVEQSGATVAQGRDKVGEMKRAIDAIGESSSRIGGIIHTIEEIAFQTNLLALNANVEAARAGEAGAGFAVVADEVRGLARKCAEAAKQSESMIRESLEKSHTGVNLAAELVEHLSRIESDMVGMSQSVSEISNSSDEQRVGVEQINSAIHSMDTVAQEAASNSESLADSAHVLNAQADEAKQLVVELEALIFGQKKPEGLSGSAEVWSESVLTEKRARGRGVNLTLN